MADKTYFEIDTGYARLVGGSTTKPQTTDFQGRPLEYKTGDRKGQPRKDYILVVAIGKNDPQTPSVIGAILNAGKEGFPDKFNPDGSYKHALDGLDGLSLKITDGDSTTPNEKGKIPCEKTGYPGMWVLTFKSIEDAPICFKDNRPIDPAQIKCGDYVNVVGSCCHNGVTGSNAGVYLNLDGVQLLAQGEPIAQRPDVSERFNSTPTAAPAWAQPVATNQAPPQTTAEYLAKSGHPSVPPQTPAVPAKNFLADAGVTPPVPPTSPAPPAPKVETRLYQGKEYTRAELLALDGWDDAIIDAHTQLVDDVPF